MALTVLTSGTSSPTVGTETTLDTRTSTLASYMATVDCAALAAGEVVFIRTYTITLTSGTERLHSCEVYIGGSDLDHTQYTIPVPADISWRVSIQQKNGTGRSFPWKTFSL